MFNSKKSRNTRSRLVRREQKVASAVNIPALNPNITLTKRLRFVINTDSTVTPVYLTNRDLSISGGVINYSSTEAYRLFQQFQLKKVEAWSSHTLGSPTTITVESIKTDVTPARYVSDTTINVSVPAHVIFNMPKPQKFVGNDGVNNPVRICKIICEANTIVDLTITYRAFDDEANDASPYSHTGLVGRISYPSLSSDSAFNMVPVARPT